jgi:tetratricopeptide (TPR) repeat protein
MAMPFIARGDQQADDLYQQYKAATAKGQYEMAAALLCKAANIDQAKYGKECTNAQAFVNNRLQRYDGYFVTGKSEFESKDYVGAIRDLSRIDFGPHREEAQKLIAQANDIVAHPQPVDTSPQALKAAQMAYDNGDFATAEANASQVKSAELEPAAQGILSSIRAYNSNIQQGDALMASKNYAAAQQKYNAALLIKSNGPGNPSGKLQQIASLNKGATPSNKLNPQDIAVRIQAGLSEGQADAAKENWQGAIAAYGRVLELDPKQPEALAGRTQAQDAMKAALSKDPKALEDTLIRGVQAFYESHFSDARDAISLYLTAGGTRSRGAAYFYLGATMLSEAIVADPKSAATSNRLRQDALQQFQQAKQEKFKPVEKYVSPKVLAVWNQTGT